MPPCSSCTHAAADHDFRSSRKRKSAMNRAEMVEFMDKCAALTGYPLPTPEELLAMGYLPH